MQQTILVSNRGQLTLPAGLRKRFGLLRGGAVILEEHNNELVIKPAAVLEIEMYADSQISQWDAEDILDDTQRAAVLKRLSRPQ
ncbi:MAG: AbrB/MazE/SpoVT family DNA-binding domain-containing protein [Desulfuromonadales bacterium]|nr:AbrB/MazE/SpoVT family DNA-binding domain-containing protein [Desulfuromonadales bacterium]